MSVWRMLGGLGSFALALFLVLAMKAQWPLAPGEALVFSILGTLPIAGFLLATGLHVRLFPKPPAAEKQAVASDDAEHENRKGWPLWVVLCLLGAVVVTCIGLAMRPKLHAYFQQEAERRTNFAP